MDSSLSDEERDTLISPLLSLHYISLAIQLQPAFLTSYSLPHTTQRYPIPSPSPINYEVERPTLCTIYFSWNYMFAEEKGFLIFLSRDQLLSYSALLWYPHYVCLRALHCTEASKFGLNKDIQERGYAPIYDHCYACLFVFKCLFVFASVIVGHLFDCCVRCVGFRVALYML